MRLAMRNLPNVAPERAEPPVREDNKPGLAVAADSGYGPLLWAEELDTPKQRLSYDEMPDRPCGRRGETEVCYTTTTTKPVIFYIYRSHNYYHYYYYYYYYYE